MIARKDAAQLDHDNDAGVGFMNGGLLVVYITPHGHDNRNVAIHNNIFGTWRAAQTGEGKDGVTSREY